MRILGIETSCDETAVAVVEDGTRVLSSLIASQVPLHEPYGGVVPEVACRAHAEWLRPMVPEALRAASVDWNDIDVVAATARPGLIGALLVGLTAGKALAWANNKPFVAVDHIEGHLHAPRMGGVEIPWPHLALVVSGGHTEIYECASAVSRRLVAATADDAAGECFDKVSALLGLGYPGGPAIEQAALRGDRKAFHFSRGKSGEDGMGLSFSGLKTALLHHLRTHGVESRAGRPRLGKQAGNRPESDAKLPGQRWIDDTAASFQEAAVDMLVRAALAGTERTGIRVLTLTGGVACNRRLGEKLSESGRAAGVTVHVCDRSLCTDNAAMIAGAAFGYASRGLFDGLETEAIPN